MIDKRNRPYTGEKRWTRFAATYCLLGLTVFLLSQRKWNDEFYFWQTASFSVLISAFFASGFTLLSEGGRVKGVKKPWVVGIISFFVAIILLWMNQSASDNKMICMLFGSFLFVLFTVLSSCLCGENGKTGAIMILYRLALSIGFGIILYLCASATCGLVIAPILGESETLYNMLPVFCGFFIPIIVFHIQIPKRLEGISGFPCMYFPLKLLLLPVWLLVVAFGYGHILLSTARHAIAPAISLYTATLGFLFYAVLCMCLLGDESRTARILIRFGWCLLLPILIIYIIGAKIRFDHHGLTTGFFASMLIIGHCLVLLWMMRRGKALHRFFAVAAVSSIVFTFTPIGVYQIPILEQQVRMQRILEVNGLYQNGVLEINGIIDEEILEKVFSCYDYLREGYEENRSAFAEAALPKNDDEFIQMYGYIPNDVNRFGNFNNYHSQIEKRGFNTEGYTYVVPAYSSENDSNQILIDYIDINGNERIVDLTEYALSLQSQYGKTCNECDLYFAADENTLLVLEYISYKTYEGSINWYQCGGYVLQR